MNDLERAAQVAEGYRENAGGSESYRRACEHIAAAIRALPGGWRPIAEAPKDGTDIILGAPEQVFEGMSVAPRSTVGHWTTDEECREEIGDCGGACRRPEYEFHEPYWLSWDGGFTEENPATHFMPLPAAPKAE